MSLEAASERMKIEMMSEEGDDDERKAKDKGVGEVMMREVEMR